jgi:hypothetical protein
LKAKAALARAGLTERANAPAASTGDRRILAARGESFPYRGAG